MSRAAQRTPTSPPAGLRWPGRRDEVSRAGQVETDGQADPKRAEQPRSESLPEDYLSIDGGG